MSALAMSVLLSVVSALAYAGGAIVQEQVAISSPDSAYLPLRRAGWWGALALNGLGGVLHVVALAFGPLSLVQPLGALTIVFALPMAALCVGRRAGATAWRGALTATVGLAGLLSLVGSSSAHSPDAAQRLLSALVTGGAVVALMCAGLAAQRHPAVRSMLLATASGIAFGMSSVFTKTVAVDWSRGIDLGDLPSFALIALFAAAGVLLSQASYRGGGLAAPLATLTVVNPVLAAAVGILMFGETFRYGGTGTVLALGCGVVAAGGLIMLTSERLERTTAPAAAEPDPAAAPAEPLAAPVAEAAAAVAPPTVFAPALPPQAAFSPFLLTALRTPAAVPSAAVLSPAKAWPTVPPQAAASPTGVFPAAPSWVVAEAVRAATLTRPGVPRQRESARSGTERGADRAAGPAAGPAAPAARALLVPGAARTRPGAGAEPPAAALPVSYVPLSVSFHVPLPDLRRPRVRS
ncbi:DMT family transporter [Streptomyces sp. NPDC015171]|uniref:DMT family transporter n=1 Tax=Streptomyces sp. NPDC015171 TaxID=3364945 RepID=UPI0036F6807F